MRIGDLARATGASVRSLRYYEQQGLLHSDRGADRRGHRRFDDEAVTTVGHIRALLAAGVPTTLIFPVPKVPAVSSSDVPHLCCSGT